MKPFLIAAAAVIGFAGVALAEGPQLLTDDQMDQVVAGDSNGPLQVVITAGEGAERIYDAGPSGYPPPAVWLDGTWINQPAN